MTELARFSNRRRASFTSVFAVCVCVHVCVCVRACVCVCMCVCVCVPKRVHEQALIFSPSLPPLTSLHQCRVLVPLRCLLQLLEDGGRPSHQFAQLRQATLPLLTVVQCLWPGQYQHVAEGLVHHYVGLGREEGGGKKGREGKRGEMERRERGEGGRKGLL